MTEDLAPSGMKLSGSELLIPEVKDGEIFLSADELSGKKMRAFSVPEGVAPSDFRNSIAVIWMEYQVSGRLITAPVEIAEKLDLEIIYVEKIMKAPQFKLALEARGLPVGGKALGLTYEQAMALQIILDPSDGLTLQKKLKKAGVSATRYRTWMRNPNFRHHVEEVAGNLIHEHLPDMMVQLVGKATEGDLNAIKYSFEVSGRHDPAANARRQGNIDVMVVLSRMQEIIQRHVKDPETVLAIAEDFRLLAEGADIGAGTKNIIEM